MPKFEKGSQEAKEYMAKIREKRVTNSKINYETNKGKKLHKNITMNLDRETEVLPNGERITKTTTKKKIDDDEPIVKTVIQEPESEIIDQEQSKKKAGRPKKYISVEEAKKAKREQTLASNRKKYAERKAKKLEGGKLNLSKSFKNIGNTIKKGFESNIEKPIISTANKLSSTVENVAGDIKDLGNAVLFGRNDYPPKVRDILKKVGPLYVNSITIKRNPVPSLLTSSLSLFSLGKFGKRLDRSFDELFHLYIEMTLDDNRRVLLEKNEVINMEINPKSRPKTESKIVNTQIPHSTIDEMLDNTQKYMGNNYFKYDAYDNNCQDFIVSFFKSNNIGDESDISFIKQDTKQLFENLPYLRKLSKTATDLGSSANVLLEGKGFQDLSPAQKVAIILKKNPDKFDPKKVLNASNYIKNLKKSTKKVSKKATMTTTKKSTKKVSKKATMTTTKKSTKKVAKKATMTTTKKIAKKREPQPEDFDNEIPNSLNKVNQRIKKYSDVLNHLTEHITDPKEPIDPRDYIQATEMINAIKTEKESLKGKGLKNKISTNNNIDMYGGKLEVHHYHHMIKNSQDSSDDEMEGGKLNIKKAINKTVNQAKDYITKKKGGLASDVVNYGIPATTGAVLGALGSATGNPMLGVLGSAAGSKLGSEIIAPEVKKLAGTGIKKTKKTTNTGLQSKPHLVKGSKEAKEYMSRLRAMRKQ